MLTLCEARSATSGCAQDCGAAAAEHDCLGVREHGCAAKMHERQGITSDRLCRQQATHCSAAIHALLRELHCQQLLHAGMRALTSGSTPGT